MAASNASEQIIYLPKTAPRIWQPVRQQAADSYLVLFIAAFGITVIAVRVFLEMTGYPQIGDKTFHIAHMLWGGLLLVIALMMLLIWDNNWVWWVSALLGGIGVGLFIDEVGKFITQSNDYFVPLAMPIIYGFMLICVWLFLRIRRSQPHSTRTLLYHSLHDLKQLVDNDLDPFEHKQLVVNLQEVVAKTDKPNERLLAKMLLSFVQAADLQIRPEPNVLERAWFWVKFIAARWPSRRSFRILLIIGFAIEALRALAQVGTLISVANNDSAALSIANFVIVNGKSRYIVDNPLLLTAYGGGTVIVGIMCAVAALLLIIGKERPGLRAGTLALALSLTGINLLTFYFSQIYAIGAALAELVLLLGAAVYRWRFYLNR
ncbi:MAG TPA: hypothetical protein VFD70_18485 [Anaerolineae bacterium]|nr:hypothetical protein [Anaerolineae bacterium]